MLSPRSGRIKRAECTLRAAHLLLVLFEHYALDLFGNVYSRRTLSCTPSSATPGPRTSLQFLLKPVPEGPRRLQEAPEGPVPSKDPKTVHGILAVYVDDLLLQALEGEMRDQFLKHLSSIWKFAKEQGQSQYAISCLENPISNLRCSIGAPHLKSWSVYHPHTW